MKSTTASTNSKGQLVIPAEMRRALQINPDVVLQIQLAGGGIHIYPVADIVTRAALESSYTQLLQKTKGAWGPDGGGEPTAKRKNLELEASKRRKKTW